MKLILDFYKGSDLYSDGDIENELLEIAKSGRYSAAIKDSTDWPILYHFSPLRFNLLRWIPFKKTDQILEIGAGCGAITEGLSDLVGQHDVIEVSKKRSEIIAERVKEKENVNIYVGNFTDIKLDRKYDYIVVVGVLEYSKGILKSVDGSREFLLYVSKLLKPGGVLILAIENRLGLKYFAGAREDHTREFFDGIYGYPIGSEVETFGKLELENLLESVGLKNRRFYYPFPDYKLPYIIYSDRYTLRPDDFIYRAPAYDDFRFVLFDAQLGFRSLAQNGLFDHFANSFLVFASKEQIESNLPIFVSCGDPSRNEKYHLMTEIYDEGKEKYVLKKSYSEEGQKHLKQMYSYAKSRENAEGIQTGKVTMDNDIVKTNYFEMQSFAHLMIDSYIRNDKDEVLKLWDRLADSIKSSYKHADTFVASKEFLHYFGRTELDSIKDTYLVDPNFDLIPDNLMMDGEKLYEIDFEWSIKGMLPFRFIIFRIIEVFYHRYARLHFERLLSKEALYEHFGIEKSEGEIFSKMLDHFYQIVLDSPSVLQQYRKKEYVIDDLQNSNFPLVGNSYRKRISAALTKELSELKAEHSKLDQYALRLKEEVAQLTSEYKKLAKLYDKSKEDLNKKLTELEPYKELSPAQARIVSKLLKLPVVRSGVTRKVAKKIVKPFIK